MMRKSIFGFCRIGLILRRCSIVLVIFTITYLFIISKDFSTNVADNSYSTHAHIDERINAVTLVPKERNFTVANILIRSYAYSILEETPFSNDSLIPAANNSVLNPPNIADNHKEFCSTIENSTSLIGHVGQAILLIEDLQESEVAKWNKDLKPGGVWRPSDCRALYKVAIIIPYRDRKTHLVRLLDFLIPILKRQRLDFRFIVTEQYGNDLFNKGRIMNAAFVLAQDLAVDCVVFHDVDMFPQDDRSPYGCSETPRHLGAFVNTLGYQLWYKEIVGGALTMNINDYINVNGYSNMYWAWGGEDDDMGTRILSLNYTIERPDDKFVRYSMLKHVKRKRLATKTVYKLLQDAGKRFKNDGLNEKDKWKVVKIELKPLYYHLLVDVGKPPEDWKDS